MIHKFINKFRRKTKPLALSTIPRDKHSISRKQINPNAIKVLYRLKNSGYQALLVGGCVRDILLGLEPKDFDVATNATPEQVRSLFGNSRTIGRRFKIVHVNFGRDTIEVATFRASHDSEQSNQSTAKANDHGMLVRDNVYGTLENDLSRRDFTVNAFYYDIADFSIKTVAQGLKDIETKTLRIIGDAEQRYREDPVRMLRAARFAAKLDFNIEEKTLEPIVELAPLLTKISSARLFDESLKLLLGGQANKTFSKLSELGLIAPLFPSLKNITEPENSYYLNFIQQALSNTDARIRQEKSITPAFLFAALLWPEFNRQRDALMHKGMPSAPASQKAAQITLADQVQHTAIPKRFSLPIKEIWDLQWRLNNRTPQKAYSLIEQARFRAGYDFLLLREQSGENTDGLGEWWTNFQTADPTAKEKLLQASRKHANGRLRRPRRAKRSNEPG